jgi:3-dehydroquinate synthase
MMMTQASRIEPHSIVIEVDLPSRSYPIVIGSGVRSRFDDLFRKFARGRRFWVTDENVARIWGDDLAELRRSSPVEWVVLPPGEEQKNLAAIEQLCRRLAGGGGATGGPPAAGGGGGVGGGGV